LHLHLILFLWGEPPVLSEEGRLIRQTACNKKPAQGGFIYYQQSLSAQAIAFIAIVNVADNERGLQRSDVAGCRAFRAIFNGERNLLAFIKGLEVVTLDCREMYEYIFAAIVRSDKAKTFICVKPFY
jgi:hypothetical protein